MAFQHIVFAPFIQEAHPLKQGLKHIYFHFHFFSLLIQEAHPLKQGLKHVPLNGLPLSPGYSRGTSTKTRIETVLVRDHGVSVAHDSRGTSTKTRIETVYAQLSRQHHHTFKRHIH